MAAIAEPPSSTARREIRARRVRKPPEMSEEERARLRARHRRNEIIGLIAFCAVLVIVFMMRNYANG